MKGLELSPFLAENVGLHLGIDVDVADFHLYESHGEQYDLVTLRHVLEHLPDSRAAMRKINSLLKPGGHALLEFPNIEGVSFRTKRLLEGFGLYTKTYGPEYRPGHCNEFSRRSFEILARETGFQLIVWETYTYSRLKNFLYNHIPIGTKARVLVKKAGK